MAKLSRKAGSTDQSVRIMAIQSSTGTSPGSPLTGLAYNSSGLKVYYQRDLAAPVEVSTITQTVTGAHSDGGFVEIDATNAPGAYRLDLPDAAFAAGVDSVAVYVFGATNMLQTAFEIDLLNDSNIASVATAAEGEIADAVLDEVVLGSYTLRQLIRGIASSQLGKLSGADSTTITIRSADDTKNVITATVDSNGNRSAITLDLT